MDTPATAQNTRCSAAQVRSPKIIAAADQAMTTIDSSRTPHELWTQRAAWIRPWE